MGAGAIRAAAGYKALAKRPPLDRDFFEIASKTRPSLCVIVRHKMKQLVGSYSSEALQSLENTTTFLYLKAIDSSPKSPAHRAFLYQLQLIEDVLANTTNDLPTGPSSLLYRLIRRELNGLASPEQLTIITFNYDLMIERVLDELQKHDATKLFTFPGCYRLPADTPMTEVEDCLPYEASGSQHGGIAVLKLHGSLNWSSTHRSKSPAPTALFSPDRKMHILNTKRMSSSLTWKKASRMLYLKPIILPPVTGKRGLLHNNLSSVWVHAASALKQASRLVIFGYSCPPLDFEAKILLGENVQPSRTNDLTVVDPNIAIARRFISLCGVAGCQVYTSMQALLSGTINNTG